MRGKGRLVASSTRNASGKEKGASHLVLMAGAKCVCLGGWGLGFWCDIQWTIHSIVSTHTLT